MSQVANTPMMAQWKSCKESSPDAVLFFRLGDFYEAFYEDAEVIANALSITLTKRQEVPMAGVPHHMLDTYLDRLVAQGYRVAIAEQTQDPKEVKGIVERKVVRTVTPGTVISSSLLQDKERSLIASISPLNQAWGLSFADITTAEFVTAEFPTKEALFDELLRLRPKEILMGKSVAKKEDEFVQELKRTFSPTVHPMEGWAFDHESALSTLRSHFGVDTLDGFGLKGQLAAINASGALLSYLRDDLLLPVDHIKKLSLGKSDSFLQLDKATQRNLELTHPLHEGQDHATLLFHLDQTKTPMGGRLLRKWLVHPSQSLDEIHGRQAYVQTFAKDLKALLQFRDHLGEIRDLERLNMRIETKYAAPRDLLGLGASLAMVPLLCDLYKAIFNEVPPFEDLSDAANRISRALDDEGRFRRGYNQRLDELYEIKNESKHWIERYQEKLRQGHGIKNLKLGYTKAFGYYIDVTKANSHKVPESFVRRQTLVNSERFVTDELKDFEYKILSADAKISSLEAELFESLRGEISQHSRTIRRLARKLAKVDVFSTFALIALQRDYVCPQVDDSTQFNIKEGRHPVIEHALGEEFIPNDCTLNDEKRLALITGPNMAGKSTYIRQAALLAILAHIGSFVPAKSAHIGLIDKVFSRIGASDDLTRGQSTFMVEMTETANILHNATDRSLVILDEIGRGTSTFDGISIAWAVAETLVTRSKTLFATHYFEMTEIADQYAQAFNLNVAVEETVHGITFLHKIETGSASKSYGIAVARLAGVPHETLRAAEKKLAQLESKSPPPKQKTYGQLEFL